VGIFSRFREDRRLEERISRLECKVKQQECKVKQQECKHSEWSYRDKSSYEPFWNAFLFGKECVDCGLLITFPTKKEFLEDKKTYYIEKSHDYYAEAQKINSELQPLGEKE
jgi:hypothetical protein